MVLKFDGDKAVVNDVLAFGKDVLTWFSLSEPTRGTIA